MRIAQFEDKGLSHFSYAVLSESAREIVLIDPSRDPQPYYDFAAAHGANIVAVVETHPHADFVSSHREVAATTGAVVLVSRLVGAHYPHRSFDAGDTFTSGRLMFRALNTPGHSPDSISVVLRHNGHDVAVFTGDTLFVGDVGRPDLRETAGNLTARREELARQLYHSTRDQLLPLADEVLVYPAHGAGSLCGRAMRGAASSTIGAERAGNYALQPMSEAEFTQAVLADQPFVPKYFGYDVALNRAGAPAFAASLHQVPHLPADAPLHSATLVVDTRAEAAFKQGHAPGALNIQNGGKFETWLGSIIGPEEPFYLVAESEATVAEIVAKAAKIGYEPFIKGTRVGTPATAATLPALNVAAFRAHPERYTIVDIRNAAEARHDPLFAGARNIPLPELRERAAEVPTDRPIVVHCAGGYRSAAGSSILAAALPAATVYDLGEAVKNFSVLVA